MSMSSSSVKLEDVEKLIDYRLELSRCRLRYCGIGSRLAGENGAVRLWPRDALKPEEECRKLLYPELRNSIRNQRLVERIESVICDLTNSLKRCRIDKLFDRFCYVEPKIVNSPFSLRNRLNAHTECCKIYEFTHNLLQAIKISQSNGQNSLIYLFGSNYNFKLYKRHLKILINGNARLKHLIIGRFVWFESLKMDVDKVDWLAGLEPLPKYRVFIQVIFALTRFLAEVLRRYFYIMISNPFLDKIFYFRYDLWLRMRDEALREYIATGLLQPLFINELGADLGGMDTSRIRFLLKKDDIRLICTKQANSRPVEMDYQLQSALVFVLANMPHNSNFDLTFLMRGLGRIREKAKLGTEEASSVFFVRADMEDCFHSINQTKLMEIIADLLRKTFNKSAKCPDQHRIKFKKYACVLRKPLRGQREVHRWSCCKELLLRSKAYLSADKIETRYIEVKTFMDNFVRPKIEQPVLRISKTSKEAFRLLSGIRQGSKNSPLLCSIYIQQALIEHMSAILTDPDGQLFRYVDDLLYVTTNGVLARLFVTNMLKGFQGYGLKSNASKLACNFDHGSNEAIRRLTDDVVFFKRRICVKTLSCSHVFAYGSISISNTFYVNPYATQQELPTHISRWARIELIHVDFGLNGCGLVIENLFQHALMVAYRIATVLLISFVLRDLSKQQAALVSQIARKVAERLFSTISLGRRSGKISNDLEFREVKLITCAAFLATWRTNKVRHRKQELDKLEARYNRHKMAYLTSVVEEDDGDSSQSDQRPRGLRLEARLRHLIFNFTKSAAWKEMRLPDKQ